MYQSMSGGSGFTGGSFGGGYLGKPQAGVPVPDPVHGRLGSHVAPGAYPECRCRNASVRSLKAWTFS